MSIQPHLDLPSSMGTRCERRVGTSCRYSPMLNHRTRSTGGPLRPRTTASWPLGSTTGSFWGTTPADYVAFEQRALESDTDGWMLDAACGSLVFTDDLFARHQSRRVVLLDHSIRMLRRARRRLEVVCGRVPDSLVLLQADIVDLPFKSGTFTTVSLPAVLHAFDDPVVPVSQLRRVLAADGTMYITSLVNVPGRAFANAYLRGMHRGGQIAAPRSVEEVARRLRAVDGLPDLHHWAKGSMGFFTNAGG